MQAILTTLIGLGLLLSSAADFKLGTMAEKERQDNADHHRFATDSETILVVSPNKGSWDVKIVNDKLVNIIKK